MIAEIKVIPSFPDKETNFCLNKNQRIHYYLQFW